MQTRQKYRTKQKQWAAGIMGMMLLIAVLFSAVYISAEAAHDCCGAGCPVCGCIRICEEVLQKLGSGCLPAISAVLPLLILFSAPVFRARKITEATPVSEKIRLNN